MSLIPQEDRNKEMEDDKVNVEGAGVKPCIITEWDLQQFKESSIRQEFVSFIRGMGHAIQQQQPPQESEVKVSALSPAMACLYGFLKQMEDAWLLAIPPEPNTGGRFGNMAFRTWHKRYMETIPNIFRTILQCHTTYYSQKQPESNPMWEQCFQLGYNVAATGNTASIKRRNEKEEGWIHELCIYMEYAFGHPIRLDYGTGHETSFYIVLFILYCKLNCGGTSTTLANMAIVMTQQYLKVTRQLQTKYMLEPAGSHGVWGLDDYHCLPFYLGACQLSSVTTEEELLSKPNCIHNATLLKNYSDQYIYLGCISYIKSLKKNVPFFESSPMLDDISHIPNWTKVSTGLLRLFEGEVLDKRPVVQHLSFGPLFPGTYPFSTTTTYILERTPQLMFFFFFFGQPHGNHPLPRIPNQKWHPHKHFYHHRL